MISLADDYFYNAWAMAWGFIHELKHQDKYNQYYYACLLEAWSEWESAHPGQTPTDGDESRIEDRAEQLAHEVAGEEDGPGGVTTWENKKRAEVGDVSRGNHDSGHNPANGPARR
jgi:hypothetical protein